MLIAVLQKYGKGEASICVQVCSSLSLIYVLDHFTAVPWEIADYLWLIKILFYSNILNSYYILKMFYIFLFYPESHRMFCSQ